MLFKTGRRELARRIIKAKIDMIKTCEFVSPKHPDKICDRVADALLDEYLRADPKARVAVEVMGGHGVLHVSGEVTAPEIDAEKIVKGIVGEGVETDINITTQSQFIARGVDNGGAGDQGIMVGYACRETETLMPLEYELARSLCQRIYSNFPNDGKVQVTVDGARVLAVVASFQNAKTAELEELARSLIKADGYFINQAGEWTLGGFDADSGLSGRKIVIDAYGPNIPVGGGSFSGKDATKVDRSGAYIARKIAVDLLAENPAAESATVKLAYVIGKPDPVMATGVIDEETVVDVSRKYDLTPAGIARSLDLRNVSYLDTASWGHFGGNFSWDN